MSVEIVRDERVQTTVLGFIPTAGQQTVVVEREMTIWLEQDGEPQLTWLPFGGLDSSIWKISAVDSSPTS